METKKIETEKKEQTKIETEVKLSDLVPIEDEGSGFDLSEFHEQKVKIKSADVEYTTKVFSQATNTFVEGKPRPQLVVRSEPLKIVKNKDGEEIEICVTEWFNLKEKDDGTIGWSTYEKAKLNLFMKAKKCKTPQELIGKDCLVKVVKKENGEDKMSFLY